MSTPTPAPASADPSRESDPKVATTEHHEPAKPATEPIAAKPATEPAKPATEPTAAKPTTEPAKPGTEPAKPGTEPTAAKPATAPAKPATAAAKPVTAPAAANAIASAPAPKPATPATPPPAVATTEPKPEARVPRSAIELRAARRRVLQRRYGIWVGIPTLLAFIYYLFVATPQYDSYLVLAIESNEGRVTEAAGKGTTAGNQRDVQLLAAALRGAPALVAVDHDGTLGAHYRDHGDWMSRLGQDSGPDATLRYFRDRVEVSQEPGKNLATVRVRAFSGAAAHDFATRLLAFARTWVAEQNRTSSAARLAQAQAELTRERAELATAAAAMAAIDQPKPTDPVAIDYQLAQKRVETALEGLQQAQLENGRAQRYLVVLDGPSQPETAAVPRRAWGIATVCVGAIVLVSVLSLLGAAVREHAKF